MWYLYSLLTLSNVECSSDRDVIKITMTNGDRIRSFCPDKVSCTFPGDLNLRSHLENDGERIYLFERRRRACVAQNGTGSSPSLANTFYQYCFPCILWVRSLVLFVNCVQRTSIDYWDRQNKIEKLATFRISYIILNNMTN